MVEPSNDNLSIRTQCRLLSINRSGWYYDSKWEPPLNLKLMDAIYQEPRTSEPHPDHSQDFVTS